jgi:hypothetical protein
MATISFTISTENISKVAEAMAGLYPIPQISDPAWEDPQDGSTAPMVPEFTPNQWAKEAIRRWVISQVARYEQKTKKDAIIYAENNALLT